MQATTTSEAAAAAVAAAKPELSAHHTPAHPRAYRTVAAAPTSERMPSSGVTMRGGRPSRSR